ncbi:MAG: hypothetical protein P8R54_27900 [Myxococcota bacterium]|nr:hypothetical protein [Myxococcota bacterium]
MISIIVLAMFICVPIMMVAALIWLGVRHLRDKAARAAAVASGDWVALQETDPALLAALADLRLSHGAVAGAWSAQPVVVVDWSSTSRSADPDLRTGERRRLVITERAQPGPRGVASRRGGGMIEAAAEGIGRLLGAAPLAAPGWQWARVAGPDGTFLSPAIGAAMASVVGPGERLHLGTDHVALSLPEGPVGPLLGAALVRVEALSDALGSRDDATL